MSDLVKEAKKQLPDDADSMPPHISEADLAHLRVGQESSVELEIRETSLLAGGEAVYEHVPGPESLANVLFREGLRPMARHDVHLSASVETAVRVGSRRGKPVVLVVDAANVVGSVPVAATSRTICSARARWWSQCWWVVTTCVSPASPISPSRVDGSAAAVIRTESSIVIRTESLAVIRTESSL